MKILKIHGDKETMLDDEDYVRFKRYNWFVSKRGYVSRQEQREQHRTIIYLHRGVMGVKYPHQYVVHINDNKLDNRKINLRVGSNSLSQGHSKAKKTRKYKGVYFRPKKNAWVSEITYKGEKSYLGYFYSAADAAIAYNEKARQLYGELARLNDVAMVEEFIASEQRARAKLRN